MPSATCQRKLSLLYALLSNAGSLKHAYLTARPRSRDGPTLAHGSTQSFLLYGKRGVISPYMDTFRLATTVDTPNKPAGRGGGQSTQRSGIQSTMTRYSCRLAVTRRHTTSRYNDVWFSCHGFYIWPARRDTSLRHFMISIHSPPQFTLG